MAQILIFGDSITDGSSDSKGGWADRLKQYFWLKNIKGDVLNNEYYWTYNLGISGNLTEDVLKRIEVESLARKVENKAKGVVFIFAIGINDSAKEGRTKPIPRLSEDQFRQNYEKLISFARKYTDKILCIGLTPVDEAKTNPIYNTIWYKNDRIKIFDDIIKQIALKNNIKYVEINKTLSEVKGFKSMLIDGIHPNDQGHKWMYEHINPCVISILNPEH